MVDATLVGNRERINSKQKQGCLEWRNAERPHQARSNGCWLGIDACGPSKVVLGSIC